jgi:uncharacterized protein (DUF2235 family)
MAKNIVLLSDGTGNSAGKFFKTNVWRLYQALDLSRTDGQGRPTQIAYYDDGVGTSAFKPLALLGGAFGWGLKRNVIDLYTFLCRNYQDQYLDANGGLLLDAKGEPVRDSIYAFGFSRGAFTIRVLTGLIHSQGLVKARSEEDLRQLATQAFREYRRAYKTVTRVETVARKARDVANAMMPFQKAQATRKISAPDIQFLGLWDTVAAYGLPIDELTRAWNWVFPLSVPDRELCRNVKRACHALALDDERNTFHPVLWNEENLPNEANIRKETTTQVWFAGMHASVGGGYPDDALAHVSLEWMLGEAEHAGVKFKADALKDLKAAKDAYGKLHDSRQGLGGLYRYMPRKLERLTNDDDDETNRVVIARPKIHESVFQRIDKGTDAYAPIVLPARYAVVDSAGAIHDQPVSGSAPVPIESRNEADARVALQEKVWDLVWWRRGVYFSTVLVAGLLAIFPLLWPPLATCQSSLCGLAWLINALGGVLPSAAAPWLDAWETNPRQFYTLVAVLAGLLLLGGWLKVRGGDAMRAIWKRSAGASAAEPGGLVFSLRTSRPYIWWWKAMKWFVLPAAAGVVSGFLVVAAASQALFALVSSTGAICSRTPGERSAAAESIENARFPTNSVCWASGFNVRQGVRYRITLKIEEAWRDNGTPTNVHGYGRAESSGMKRVALPFRRYLSESWFKPVARIGHRGSDEYPLQPSDALNLDTTGGTLIAEFTARRNGELFLFVNDVVWPLPAAWQTHYANNAGTALVSVTPRGFRGSRPPRAAK